MKLIQLGYNDKYPEEIETWKLGDTNIPTWLSDICHVKAIDGNGNPVLDLRMDSTGYEIIESGTNRILIKVPKDNIVCFGGRKLFSLTQKQLDLLYG